MPSPPESTPTPEVIAPALVEINPRSDEFFMDEALRMARKAFAIGEVPVGAVVVSGGRVIARAYNQVEMLKDENSSDRGLISTRAGAMTSGVGVDSGGDGIA